MFGALKAQSEDKIIKLLKEFRSDPRERKIDLGVGVYRDHTGLTPIMTAVKDAERELLEREATKSYTSIPGDPGFRNAMIDLVLGQTVSDDRLASAHTPGGTGAVRQALELVRSASPNAAIWISDPSWPNHQSMVNHVGLERQGYRYFDESTRSVDLEGMIADLSSAKPGDVVILHGCCHNPTGANLGKRDWLTVRDLLLEKDLIPLVDIAYQGFGDGLEEDAGGVRLLANSLPEMLVAASCSKNFGIYRERTGVLVAVARSSGAAITVQQSLTHLNRQNFSFPPDHGARLVTMILEREDLRKAWEAELEEIRLSMLDLRKRLASELGSRSGSDRFEYIAAHRGMFSRLGASEDQVMKMRRDAGIYMVSDSRINIAGLNGSTVPILADAMLAAGL